MEYLGIIIDSNQMIVSLPLRKVDAIIDLCEQFLSNKNVTIRSIAALLGKFSSSFVAVPLGKLHLKTLERCKVQALRYNHGNFNRLTVLCPEAIADITWWKYNIASSHAPIVRDNPSCTLTTDASSTGWGAIFHEQRTGGVFTMEEIACHINLLELKAVTFGLKALTDDVVYSHMLIQIDNTTAVAAINKMGSIKSLPIDREVHKIWQFAIAHKMWITATHIPGILNKEADAESRKSETRTECQLNITDLSRLIEALQFTPVIDLFATRVNTQLPKFIAYRPDPDCQGVNAFTMSWGNLAFYAFPPFSCLGRVIKKICHDKAKGILIIPDWPNQPWYTQYCTIVQKEITLTPRPDILQLPGKDILHPLHRHLSLKAAVVQGNL